MVIEIKIIKEKESTYIYVGTYDYYCIILFYTVW